MSGRDVPAEFPKTSAGFDAEDLAALELPLPMVPGGGKSLLPGQRQKMTDSRRNSPQKDIFIAGRDVPAELPKTSARLDAEDLAALELPLPIVPGRGKSRLQGQRQKMADSRKNRPQKDAFISGHDVPAELPKTSAGFDAEDLAAVELPLPMVPGGGKSRLQGQRQKMVDSRTNRQQKDVFISGHDVPAELPKTSAGFDAKDLAPVVHSSPEGHRLMQSMYTARHRLPAGSAGMKPQHHGPWHHDVFTSSKEHSQTTPQDIGFRVFFQSADYDEWRMLLITVLGLMMVDFCFLRHVDHKSTYTNLFVLAFWLVAAAIYNGIVCFRMGAGSGVSWCSGYLLEWLLSLDNIFVFHLIFRLYKTPPKLLHKALFWGIVGAIIFRAFFFMTLSTLLHAVHWFRVVFGVLLIYSGIQAAREEDENDPTESWPIVALKACLGSRMDDSYDEETSRLFVWRDNQLRATLLVPVIMCLEVTDILFAVDSVSAKVAQIPDPYICYSSSVLAMFGLRAMFFVIRDLVDHFDLLKYGICFVLVFIGLELMVADYVALPAQVVLVVIISVFAVCIAASAARRMKLADRNGLIASVVEAKSQDQKLGQAP